ncbi:DUF6335 family protein [Planktothrix sp. FACHB-1365]|uniref:DUF6335 family protein n=1 Tax=Planktothrix sp. FACHB-1365 TaxID=2692855 RepID=UPI001F5533B1|nr:DUF6335 family protein [Planktothrix sp. FACHB-1365]
MANRTHPSKGKKNQLPHNQNLIQEIKDEIELNQNQEPTLAELASIEEEIGLIEISVDPEELNTVMIDDTDDNWDINDDDVIDESDDPEMISDLPPEITQSLGTGLQGQPTDRAGRRAHLSQSDQFNQASAILTGGDIDANFEQANAVGDEAVGGTVATPDQDIVEEIAAAVGLEMRDRSSLRTTEFLEKRDDQRWELDPTSSEDYEDRENESL